MSITSATAAEPRRRLATPALPLIIAFYATAAFVIAPSIFMALLFDYARQMRLLAEILLVTLPLAALILRPSAPAERLAQILREGGVRLMIIVGVFCVAMAAFTTLKIQIPKLVPFYADRTLANIDAWLHNGDPGVMLHRLVPEAAGPAIGFAYGYLWLALWFGLLGFVALHRDAELRNRYLWSMTLTFIVLGTVLATLLSSVGPIFYKDFISDDRFSKFMQAVFAGAAGGTTERAAAYLLAAYQGNGDLIGTGISAMPSMHVALATLNALMLSRVNRIVGAFGWSYLAVILMSSVYLGWHYAIDGYVSIAIVSGIWWLCRRPIERRLGIWPAARSA